MVSKIQGERETDIGGGGVNYTKGTEVTNKLQ